MARHQNSPRRHGNTFERKVTNFRMYDLQGLEAILSKFEVDPITGLPTGRQSVKHVTSCRQ